MRIGLDLRPLQGLHRYRGVGSYIKNLAEELSVIDQDNTYVFILRGNAELVNELQLKKGFKYESFITPKIIGNELLYKIACRFYNSVDLSKAHLDAIIAFDTQFRFGKNSPQTIGVVYDLIPLIFYKETLGRGFFRLCMEAGVKKALINVLDKSIYKFSIGQIKNLKHIIAISNNTKDDLYKLLPETRKTKVYVTHLGVNPKLYGAKLSNTELVDLGINKKYLFYLGAADYRKNVGDLVDAFEAIKARGIDYTLVLAGRDFSKDLKYLSTDLKTKLTKSPYIKDIVLLGFASDELARKLLASATVFVYPSLYEGFGIPVLESMASHVPVVSLDNSSISEIATGAALLAGKNDNLVDCLARLINDDKLRNSLIEKGTKRASEFSWEATATNTLKVINEVTK